MEKYDPSQFEKRLITKWQKEQIYAATDNGSAKKSYILIEFPYPSGERLHVGHARSYSCLDAVARKRRMQGENVMFPLGWDAFGLPAENYALKTGIHPSITTAANIANAKAQAMSWGLSFDWNREINTTDPEYYRWTQWIFVQLFRHGLAYKSEIAVNWCPSCKTNLANEEVIDGKCERCGTQTVRRKQSQWLLRITKYAQRLLDDLETVNYRSDIKRQQINWIGKSNGHTIQFSILNSSREARSSSAGQLSINVFTTRVDTLHGATFLALAPDHPQVIAFTTPEKRPEIDEFVKSISTNTDKSDKNKSGVYTGTNVINPATGKSIPVWVVNYVTADYGTGAIMGVPAHDERDAEFASKYGIDIVEMEPDSSMEKYGTLTTTFHLRDWVFSRQHYWGEPIPMINCQDCGWQPVPEDQLPVELPAVEKYQPTETGESPLAGIPEWVNTICPKCGSVANRETDTMPNWAGSSWYFMRYCDPHNNTALADPNKLKYWLPVDWYNGGMEHTTLHLLYSRFWYKFLFDIGVAPTPEPYAKRTSHGVVLGPDSRKMSKSKGNVINPDDIVAKYGADTLRLYEMFMGPFEQMVAWSQASVEGVYRFLKRVWALSFVSRPDSSSSAAIAQISRLAKKVDSDLENVKFNTAVSSLMEFVNFWSEHQDEVGEDVYQSFLKILAPLAPFTADELFSKLDAVNKTKSVHTESWPVYADELSADKEVTIVIQVNGVVRDTLVIDTKYSNDKERLSQLAQESAKIKNRLDGAKIRTIFIPGKVINFVTE